MTMAWIGVLMFACALALMILTGLPVFVVLIGVASAFGALGLALGAFDLAWLGALFPRLVGLLEHDLLQALPLYALIGALLNRLPLAALLHRAATRLFGASPAAPELAALGVGALLAPMNGSVGASLHTLGRGVAPALAAAGAPPERTAATLCVASTLGVVIPPSLVLLLLGDALMRAHTEAVNVTGAAVRIVNTQDVMRAALLPGALVLVLALGWVAWRGRRGPRLALLPARGRDLALAAGVAAAIAGLLGMVAAGRLYAVEAAATGGLVLLVGALATRHLDLRVLRAVLDDALTLTGVLLALLVAATTFSLVLRGFGTDRLVAEGLSTLAASPRLLLACVLVAFVGCSFVLDAFEMVFLVVPLVMPAVLAAVPDPAWVAALTLLVLQAGFLLPPFGYAVVMARSMIPGTPGPRALGRALLPHLLLQAALIAAVLTWPELTRVTRPVEAASPTAPAPDAERLLQEAIEAQQRDAAQRSAEKP
jgi:TRAP-type mannitol/chloroaromatic compound transport system permease large subunit